MKRTLKLAAVTFGLAAAAWISGNRPAQAIDDCFHKNGTSCSPSGSQAECLTDDNLIFTCTCTSFRGAAPTWLCPY